MTQFKILKDGEDEYYIQVKRKGQYPFTIHRRFMKIETAKEFIKLNRNKYKSWGEKIKWH